MSWRYYQYDSRQENQTVGVNYMTGITEQIKEKAEIIAENLHKGKHVELCENKEGLRIIVMDRKVVK